MGPRIHTGGRFRAWLGHRLGGDAELGDRAWRRVLHGVGALVLVYYLVPDGFFVVVAKEYVLLGALGAVLLLEALRHAIGLELPTIRPYEAHRIASFAFYGIALVGAILLFPPPIAVAVVLGVALVDPIAGELRQAPLAPALRWGLPMVAYFPLALVGLRGVGSWPWGPSLALSALAAILGVASERPKVSWLDDDLLMTFVPAIALYVLGVVWLALPS